MKLLILFLILGVTALGYRVLAAAWRRHRRRALLAMPFPPAWLEILRTNLPPYRHLPAELQQQLQDRIRIFIGEKNFEG